MGKYIGVWRSVLLGLSMGILLLASALSLNSCGKKEPEPSAEGYYEGPMKPKTERGISPTPGGGETQVGGGQGGGQSGR